MLDNGMIPFQYGVMNSFQNADAAGIRTAQFVAAEVRAEMARQSKSQSELAEMLGVTGQTAGRRLSGSVPFDIAEISLVADWLGRSVVSLLPSGSPSNASAAS